MDKTTLSERDVNIIRILFAVFAPTGYAIGAICAGNDVDVTVCILQSISLTLMAVQINRGDKVVALLIALLSVCTLLKMIS